MATYLLEALDEVKRKMVSSLSSSTYVELAALGVSLSLVATAGGVGVKRALVSRTKGKAKDNAAGEAEGAGEGGGAEGREEEVVVGEERTFGRAGPRAEGDLALRSQVATKPALSYIDVFVKALGDLWAPANPKGYIVLLVAENKLTTEVLSKRMKKVTSVGNEVFCYDSFRGTLAFRSAVASYATTTFAKGCEMDPEHLAISAGCGAVIDNVCFCVCDSGSEVLIPAPYYPAFDNDLRVRSNVVPVPVLSSSSSSSTSSSPGGFLPSNEDLDAAFASCKNPRILLLTNPHNPLGVVVARAEMKRCIKWALQKGMQVVSDEIYASSIHGQPPAAEFASAVSLMPELSAELGKGLIEQRLHTIFGFSKDFCASGLRIGVLYSKNQKLLTAIDNIGYFCGVSGHTQCLMTDILRDQKFVHKFLKKNNKNLRKSYERISSLLEKNGIGFVPADAGMFVWIDCRKYLKKKTWEGEMELWTGLAQDAKVLFTPGKDCHAREPGYFRICFAWMPEEALTEAMERVVKFIENF